jgi:hypothetical protein
MVSDFDKLVLYQMCDFLYDAHKKMSKKSKIFYDKFTTLCNSLSQKIINGVSNFNKGEKIILNMVMDRLSKFFGLTDSEIGNYIYIFFTDKYWLKTYQSILAVNSVFASSKNI